MQDALSYLHRYRASMKFITERLTALNWDALSDNLDTMGYALTPQILDADFCASIAADYDDDTLFRSTVNMARHGFGKGQYRYFAYPLPAIIETLRTELYPHLARIANLWAERLRQPDIWPLSHDALIARCHGFGQARPTPLMLRYREGDYNCLHQDLYGAIHFPLQAIIMLSPPEDFEGGALTIVENRPRMQSRVEVVPIKQGQIVIVPVRDKPRAASQGWARSVIRHGVSTVLRGQRQTLGIIFHDAT
jgi:uncharacterized protein